MEIITSRPEGMSYQEYKTKRMINDKVLKHYLRGKIVWLSKLEPTPQVMEHLVKDNLLNTFGRLLHKGETFKGSTKDLK